VPGRSFAGARDWVEADLALGTTAYAIVDGDSALVYDTHVSPEHGRSIRRELEGRGVRRFSVVLSHWHLDHVAGTAAFADCEVIANERTAALLAEKGVAIRAGEELGPPGIDPLILPTRTFSGRESLMIGGIEVELVEFEIHSPDATVLRRAGDGLLLAGDTLEDTVTFVDEPERLGVHLDELERLRNLGANRVLPTHGDPDLIGAGGYGPGLIDATEDYVRALLRMPGEPALAEAPLRELIAPALAGGDLTWNDDYADVHALNVRAVLGSG
jgi:glyoxylase-like metal-dependent hydrolase (beta-lactamase superfamily II)